MSAIIRGSSTSTEVEVAAPGALWTIQTRKPTGPVQPVGLGVQTTGAIASSSGEFRIDTDGMAGCTLHITGVFSGTLSFFASADDSSTTNIFPVLGVNVATGVATLTTGAVGAFFFPTAYKFLIVRFTTYTSGTAACSASVQPNATPYTPAGMALNAGASSGGVTIGSVRLAGAPLIATAQSAAGEALTLTLPKVASSFHYISALRFEAHYAGAVTAQTALALTTANVPASAFFAQSLPAGNAGVSQEKSYLFPEPLRSLATNTSTTFTMPAIPNVVWYALATYRAGV